MTRRALGMLAVVGGLVSISSLPAAARAECPTPFWGIYCPENFELATPFGPVARATQVSEDGRARYGNYSPLTGEFLPATDWMPIHQAGWVSEPSVRSSDGQLGSVIGYASVETAFGPAAWVTQYAPSPTDGSFFWGRWGIYNFLTRTFYPEGEWYPLSSSS